MQGFMFKTTSIIVTLIAAIFSGSPLFAAAVHMDNQAKLYSAAGCMGCHQGEAMTVDKTPDKNSNSAKHKHYNQIHRQK